MALRRAFLGHPEGSKRREGAPVHHGTLDSSLLSPMVMVASARLDYPVPAQATPQAIRIR
jgi:hypothetical protein